jgi:ribosomal biogenesis protein LAS1
MDSRLSDGSRAGRFVTGLVDSKLHGLKRTMFQRAMDLGLPASFVELRHEATHRELPSLVVLRGATQRSLEWLWNYYWAQIDRIADVDMQDSHGQLEAIRVDIRRTLGDMSRRFVEEPPRNLKIKDYNTDSVAKSLTTICKGRSQGTQILSRVLLEEDMIVPPERQ